LVNKSVTSEEVRSEIGSKTNEIRERVEIADDVLHKDFSAMPVDFTRRRQGFAGIVQLNRSKCSSRSQGALRTDV
jgi:hypothetical protein